MTPPERRMAERPPGSEVWSRERREAWRAEFFEEQFALEAEERRHLEALKRAAMLGAIGGLIISGAALLF